MDATKEFYLDVLGLDCTSDFVGSDGIQNFYVGGDGGAEIQFKYDPDEQVSVEPSGFAHVAVAVDDADAEFNRITEKTDCPVVYRPSTTNATGARTAFVEDPDGYVVELVENP